MLIMEKHERRDLPIRSKIEMAEDVGKIISSLHRGERSTADLLIEDLKVKAIYLDETIQQDVLSFAEQVQFQYDYDPWHKVTLEVVQAADRLIESLGFSAKFSEDRSRTPKSF